jgi:hypothetical protein
MGASDSAGLTGKKARVMQGWRQVGSLFREGVQFGGIPGYESFLGQGSALAICVVLRAVQHRDMIILMWGFGGGGGGGCLFAVLGLELRAFTLSHSTRSHKLFAQAGFEPQSS